jgi:hypothetical protein
VRRTDRALAGVEEQIRWCAFGWNGRTAKDVPQFEAERLRLEARLRALLDPDGQPDPLDLLDEAVS